MIVASLVVVAQDRVHLTYEHLSHCLMDFIAPVDGYLEIFNRINPPTLKRTVRLYSMCVVRHIDKRYEWRLE